MPKKGGLRHGAVSENAVHLCVDMQRMFAAKTEWQMPYRTRFAEHCRYNRGPRALGFDDD
jgi:hypothetical protein